MAIYHELSFVQRMCWYPTSAVPVSTIMQPLICRKRFLFFAIQACQADTSRKKFGLYLLEIAYSRQGFGGGVFLTKNIFMIRSWTFPKKNFLRSLETAPGANSESEPSWFFLQSSESSPGPRFRILSSTSDSPDELSSILTYGTVSKYFKKKKIRKTSATTRERIFLSKAGSGSEGLIPDYSIPFVRVFCAIRVIFYCPWISSIVARFTSHYTLSRQPGGFWIHFVW